MPQALGADCKLLAKADSVDVINVAFGGGAGFHVGAQLVAAGCVVDA